MMECPVQCGRNAHAAPGFFSLAGTAVKASETDAQPDAAGSVLRGLGSLPNKQKIAFVSRKPCLPMWSSTRIFSPPLKKRPPSRLHLSRSQTAQMGISV